MDVLLLQYVRLQGYHLRLAFWPSWLALDTCVAFLLFDTEMTSSSTLKVAPIKASPSFVLIGWNNYHSMGISQSLPGCSANRIFWYRTQGSRGMTQDRFPWAYTVISFGLFHAIICYLSISFLLFISSPPQDRAKQYPYPLCQYECRYSKRDEQTHAHGHLSPRPRQ